MDDEHLERPNEGSAGDRGASPHAFPLVTLLTSDLPASVGFYCEILGARSVLEKEGLVVIEHRERRFALYRRDALERYLDLDSSSRDPMALTSPSVVLSLNMKTSDEVYSLHHRLTEHGVRVVKPPHRTPWSRCAAFYLDPDDNLVELNSPSDS